jgi:hypothetical protein
MDTTATVTLITDAVADIGTVLSGGLASVLGLLAVLIGLFFVLRLVWRKVGRGR